MSLISKKFKKSNTLTLACFDQTMGAPVLLGILFFFIVCLGAADSIKKTVMVVAVFALLVIAVRFKVLRERIYWPLIALTLYVIMGGISTFYAVSGKFALREFLKAFLAYLLAVILLATSPKKEEARGKRIATILAVCTAFGSLVSIDLISTRWISGAATWVLGWFTEAYKELNTIAGGYSRMNSIFSNANVFSGFSGIGILLTLGLADNSKNRERLFYLALAYINSLAFILSNSLGAMFFIVLSVVFWFITKPKGSRVTIAVSIIEVLVPAAVFSVIIVKKAFRQQESIQLIPLLSVVVGAALICVLDHFVSKRITIKERSSQKAKAMIAVVCIAVVAFAVAAFTLTSDIQLKENNSLTRIAHIRPGNYTLDVQADGKPLTVSIINQNADEIKLHSFVFLYNGSAYEAAFAVPEDSVLVSFIFHAPEGCHIDSAAYSGHRIPLRYRLLPSFIVDRLQTRNAIQSYAQRLVYFQDGFKLFLRSPVFGLGMGGFENGIKGVQSYYYETKYAHNHYFQTLLETGVIGLLLFLALLLTSAAAVWKARKKQPYAPMLGAILLFMAGQALHDIIFSAYAYLPIAYGCFAIINYTCGEEIVKPKLTKAIQTVAVGAVIFFTIVYCAFLAGNLIAKRQVDQNPTVQSLVNCVKLDQFEWADYALPYVVNATGENVNPYVRKQADEFAIRLSKKKSNTIPIYLAEYYFQTGRPEQGIAMLEKYVDYVSSDQSAWQQAFDLLQAYAYDSDVFYNGIIRLAQKLETWKANNLGDIQLNDATTAMIDRIADE